MRVWLKLSVVPVAVALGVFIPLAAGTARAAAEQKPQVEVEDEVAPKLYYFRASRKKDNPVVLDGVVPADATRRYLGVIAENGDISNLYVSPESPGDFIDSAIAGIRALMKLEDGELRHEYGKWALNGTARDDATRQATGGTIAALGNVDRWTLDIALVPPIELCRAHVETLAVRNAIVFAPGSARLASESLDEIDELSRFLEECPDTDVEVEGHTDADGEAEANLDLSVARAEAIIAELVSRGVKPERLYAVGFGESLPLVPNDTAEGKSRNRRIAFRILDRNP